MKKNIVECIRWYAEVYASFEALQRRHELPTGDQKTGVIAEYYAKCYIEATYHTESTYASPGESHDVSYQNDGRSFKVQVKAVSAHSKTRIMSPLNLGADANQPPFDELYLISLDKLFLPDGFYINTYDQLRGRSNGKSRIQGTVMCGNTRDGRFKIGSALLDFRDNLAEVLKSIINERQD